MRPFMKAFCAPALAAATMIAGNAHGQTPSMHEACLARGTWDRPTCDCMKRIADSELSPENQVMAVRLVTRQTTIAQIIATSGAARADAFVAQFTAFGTASRAECGAP